MEPPMSTTADQDGCRTADGYDDELFAESASPADTKRVRLTAVGFEATM